MEVFIVKSNGYEDGESIIEGVFKYSNDAKAALRDLRKNMDPFDKEWLFYTLESAEVIEDY